MNNGKQCEIVPWQLSSLKRSMKSTPDCSTYSLFHINISQPGNEWHFDYSIVENCIV